MEKYSFKVYLKGADRGGYYALFRVMRSYLNKAYPESHIKLDKDHFLVKNVGKEDKTKNEIITELKDIIDKNTISWKKKGVTLEDITEKVLKEEPQLHNAARDIIDSLKETIKYYQDQLSDYKSNEDAYITEIKRLEEIVLEQQKQLKNYETEDRKYIREVDLENKQLRGETKEAKLAMMKIKHTAERFFKSAPRKRASLLDSVKKALGEGCSTPYQILDYLTKNNIHTSDAYLRIVLYKAVKGKDIIRSSKGHYDLFQIK